MHATRTLGTMRLAGQMLSMGIAMMVLAIFVGNFQINRNSILHSLKV
jgi:hypothetical protein